jgi:hypothetical protein
LIDEAALDRYNRVLWKLHFTTPTTAHYTNADGIPRAPAEDHSDLHAEESPLKSKIRSQAATGLPQLRSQSGAVYIRYEWSPQGYPQAEYYLDANGRPQPDDGGVYGVRREHADNGQWTRWTYLGPDGQPTKHRYEKVATTTRVLNPDWYLDEEIAYWDAHDQRCLNNFGVAMTLQATPVRAATLG